MLAQQEFEELACKCYFKKIMMELKKPKHTTEKPTNFGASY